MATWIDTFQAVTMPVEGLLKLVLLLASAAGASFYGYGLYLDNQKKNLDLEKQRQEVREAHIKEIKGLQDAACRARQTNGECPLQEIFRQHNLPVPQDHSRIPHES